MLSAIPRRPTKISLDCRRDGVNALLAVQTVQRPLYELVGQRMGNARWCQLPFQLPRHKKAVSLSFASPPIAVWKDNSLGKQSVRGSRHVVSSSKGDKGAIDRREPSLMQGYMDANAWKAKAVRQQMQGTQ